jgi:hypothetical protein
MSRAFSAPNPKALAADFNFMNQQGLQARTRLEALISITSLESKLISSRWAAIQAFSDFSRGLPL